MESKWPQDCKLDPQDLEKVVNLQRFVRRRRDQTKIAGLTAEAQKLKGTKVTQKQKPSLDAEDEQNVTVRFILGEGRRSVITQTNWDVWFEIFSFTPDLRTAVAMMKTCHLLNEFTKFNLFWQPVLQYHFPLAIESVPQEDPESINWHAKVKELSLLRQAFQQVLTTLAAQKEHGNEHFRKKKWQEAADVYLGALKFSREAQNSPQNYQEVLTTEMKVEHQFVLAVLYANAAQTQLRLDEYAGALHNAVQAEKCLKTIKKIVGALRYKTTPRFKQLQDKVAYRIGEAIDGLGPMARVVNYSSQPVEGLQQGSLLIHNPAAFSGFFDDSKVLMTEMSNERVVGLIVNKTYQPEGREAPVYIGGPCEIDHVTVLHNVANAPGAVRVIDGVYQGGDLTDFKDEPGVIIRQYHGYASWFHGQLQGEILNSNGWEFVNDITADNVFRPDELAEFDERVGRSFAHYF